MTWRTHALVGANAVWLTAVSTHPDHNVLLLLLAGAIAGLLPDIDAGGRGAKIHYVAGGTLSMFKNIFTHRSFFHSVLCVLFILLLGLLFLTNIDPLLPWVITLGYTSHLVIDGFNKKGTRYLFPIRKTFHLIPKSLRSPVGGWMDMLLFVLSAMSLLFFLLQLTSTNPLVF